MSGKRRRQLHPSGTGNTAALWQSPEETSFSSIAWPALGSLITRTSAGESNPRWARNDTAVTFVRDNCLYLVPLGEGADRLVQINDAGPRKRDPQLSESQKYVEKEEASLIEAVKEAEKRRKKNEERAEKEKLPLLELADRQGAMDLMLGHNDQYVYALDY